MGTDDERKILTAPAKKQQSDVSTEPVHQRG